MDLYEIKHIQKYVVILTDDDRLEGFHTDVLLACHNLRRTVSHSIWPDILMYKVHYYKNVHRNYGHLYS
jgi:hypothetical protein